MAVIDSNNFITQLVWSGLIDKATCGELKEAIELCTVKDSYTKADMVAMLDDLQLEIEEHLIKPIDNDAVNFNKGIFVGINEIQQKINALKEDRSEEE